MAIVLIIEDGSIVANANSYGDLEPAKVYATNRGVNLGTDDEKIKAWLINAMDYLEGLKYKGELVEPGVQALSWPRKKVIIDGHAFVDNAIPSRLINAQYQLVIEQKNGISIMPTTSGAFITREKVGPIETEYSAAIASSSGLSPSMPLVDALLAGLLGAGKFSLTTYRV